MDVNTRNAIAALVLSLALAASGWTRSDNKADKIDGLMRTYHQNGLFNGSVLVAERAQVIYTKGWGEANFEWHIPNTPDTKFRIGSLTKQFTAMLVMQLVERGDLALDGTVSAYLPGYPRPQGDKITIHHLLTHRAGIPNYTGLLSPAETHRSLAPAELVATFSSRELEFEPGTQFRYSNSNYVLLAYIVGQVSGKPYQNLLQERVFAPAGMTSSGDDQTQAILPKRASGYDRIGGLRHAAHFDFSAAHGAGSVYSSVEDLYRWDRALADGRLLGKAHAEIYYTPLLGDYACGWGVERFRLATVARPYSATLTRVESSGSGRTSLAFRTIST